MLENYGNPGFPYLMQEQLRLGGTNYGIPQETLTWRKKYHLDGEDPLIDRYLPDEDTESAIKWEYGF